MNPWVHFRFTTDLAQQKAIGDSERDVYLTYTKLQYVLKACSVFICFNVAIIRIQAKALAQHWGKLLKGWSSSSMFGCQQGSVPQSSGRQ